MDLLISRQMFEPTLYRDKPRSCYGFCKYLSQRALTETYAMDVNQGGAEGHIHAWRRMRIFLMRQTGLRPIELLTAVNIV